MFRIHEWFCMSGKKVLKYIFSKIFQSRRSHTSFLQASPWNAITYFQFIRLSWLFKLKRFLCESGCCCQFGCFCQFGCCGWSGCCILLKLIAKLVVVAKAVILADVYIFKNKVRGRLNWTTFKNLYSGTFSSLIKSCCWMRKMCYPIAWSHFQK